MTKWITAICVTALICSAGCGKKKEASPENEVPPKLNSTSNKPRNPESKKAESGKPAGQSEHKAASITGKSEFADLSVGELWKVYKQCRTDAEKAKGEGRYRESIELMLKGAQAADKLEKPGIAAWQYNNAAKHAIDYFKAESNYAVRMRSLTGMKPGDDKIAYKKETKKIMKDKIGILEDAETYLKSAKMFNEIENDPKRVSAIESNMRFVKEIALFIE